MKENLNRAGFCFVLFMTEWCVYDKLLLLRSKNYRMKKTEKANQRFVTFFLKNLPDGKKKKKKSPACST